MIRETKDYYQRFYHFRLTNNDVRRIIQRLQPVNR